MCAFYHDFEEKHKAYESVCNFKDPLKIKEISSYKQVEVKTEVSF
jgi:hypothetical protein